MLKFAIVLLLLIVPLVVEAQQSTPEATPGTEVDQAQQILQMFVSGDYAGIYAQVSAQVKAAITQAQLQQAWEGIVKAEGAFQTVSAAAEDPTTHAVTLTLQFEHGLLDAHIAFANDQISGLNFTPSKTAVAPTPTYADPSAFIETPVTVGEYKLPGILTLPKGDGPFPAVVLISGSGPNDYDETIGPNKPFRDIAWGLAANGIASLRFDKRTYAAKQSLDITHLTVKEEYIDDSIAAVELLRSTSGIDPAKVFILGHSEGGYVAPRIAAADSAHIAGVIIASGAANPIPEIMLRQYRYLTSLGESTPEATENPTVAAIATQVAQVNALTASSPADQMVLNAPPSCWLDLKGYDPVALAATLPQPILVLQGGRDYQATVADEYSKWQAGLAEHADTTFKLYPDLNHLYMTGTGMATPAEYGQPGNVAEAVINDIAAWVKAH